MNDWISVKERIPNLWETVLIYIYNKKVCAAQRYCKATEHGDSWWKILDDGGSLPNWCDNADVTHWMPLPNPPEELNPILNMRLDQSKLSSRAKNGLFNVGIDYLYQLINYSKADLYKIRNFGKKTQAEIIDFVNGLGLQFAEISKVYEYPMPERPDWHEALSKRVSWD